MRTDMSPHAVTLRLKQTSELRRLCLALAKRERSKEASGAVHREGEETAPLLRSPGNAGRLREAVEPPRSGGGTERELPAAATTTHQTSTP